MRNDFSSNYLAHHGILGQKWGHKNGPPYPLDAGDHSASEKKAGYKKSIKGAIQEARKKTKRYQKDLEDYKSARWKRKYANDRRLIAEEGLEEAKASKKKDPKFGEDYFNMAINAHKEEAAEAQKRIDKFIKRYGDVDLKDMQLTDGEKYIELRDKGYSKEDSMIIADHKQIASSVAKEMVSDLKRWQKEDDIPIAKSLSNKTDSEMQKILASKIAENIKNYDADSIYDFGNGIVNFGIDGLSEYSDNQPLTIEYDLKNKKVKNFYYT